MAKKECNITVSIRVRPFLENEKPNELFTLLTSNELFINDRKFIYDNVFKPNASQKDLYTNVIKPTIKDLFGGYNCTVLAYGCTGSGKTFTMLGENISELQEYAQDSLSGCIPRALAQIFQQIATLSLKATVKISFVEMYNEEIFDLLNSREDAPALNLYTDPRKKERVYLMNLKEIQVNNYEQASNLILQGISKRSKAETASNQRSSRSHAVFMVTVAVNETNNKGVQFQKVGKLTLIDLAGSESLNRKNIKEKRAIESSNINKSLWNLGRVIQALSEKGAAHVPYRDSKLTRLLQDSLGGATKTCIIATVGPSQSDMDNTLNTLEYAFRARKIMNCPEVNMKVKEEEIYDKMAEELQNLKRDLEALHSASGYYVDLTNYENMVKTLEDFQDKVRVQEGFIDELKLKLEQYQSDKENINNKYEKLSKMLAKGNGLLENYKVKIDEKRLELAKERFIIEYYEKIESEIKSLAERLIVTNKNLVREHESYYKRLQELYASNKMFVETVFRTFDSIEMHLDNVDKYSVEDIKVLIENCSKMLNEMISIATETLKDEKREIADEINVKEAIMLIYEEYYAKCHVFMEKIESGIQKMAEKIVFSNKSTVDCEKKVGAFQTVIETFQHQVDTATVENRKRHNDILSEIDELIADFEEDIEEDETQLIYMRKRMDNNEKQMKKCETIKINMLSQRDRVTEEFEGNMNGFLKQSDKFVHDFNDSVKKINKDLIRKSEIVDSHSKELHENIKCVVTETENCKLQLNKRAAEIDKQLEESTQKLFFCNKEKCTNLSNAMRSRLENVVKDTNSINSLFNDVSSTSTSQFTLINSTIDSCLKAIPIVKKETFDKCDNVDLDEYEIIEFPSRAKVCELFEEKLASGEIVIEDLLENSCIESDGCIE